MTLIAVAVLCILTGAETFNNAQFLEKKPMILSFENETKSLLIWDRQAKIVVLAVFIIISLRDL